MTTTGDGTLTGLHLAALVAASGRRLSEQPRLVHTPQVLENVRVKARTPIDEVPELRRAIDRAEETLRGRGRLLVRYSGTEPLLRVMFEADDAGLVATLAREIADHARAALGTA